MMLRERTHRVNLDAKYNLMQTKFYFQRNMIMTAVMIIQK